jgi:hypothetical protein
MSDDKDNKAPTLSLSSANELKLDAITPIQVVLPLSRYEKTCPKCKKIASDDRDWMDDEMVAAGANFFFHSNVYFVLRHCSNGHWWIPNSPKVFTEEQMKQIMPEKKEAGNPCAHLHVGKWDPTSDEWLVTEADHAYVAKHEWKAVSLTREEYFGADVYNKELVRLALAKLAETRKVARKLSAYTKKLSAQLKPKGRRGRKEKSNVAVTYPEDD